MLRQPAGFAQDQCRVHNLNISLHFPEILVFCCEKCYDDGDDFVCCYRELRTEQPHPGCRSDQLYGLLCTGKNTDLRTAADQMLPERLVLLHSSEEIEQLSNAYYDAAIGGTVPQNTWRNLSDGLLFQYRLPNGQYYAFSVDPVTLDITDNTGGSGNLLHPPKLSANAAYTLAQLEEKAAALHKENAAMRKNPLSD